MEFKTMSQPDLIQRGHFRDITEEQIEGIDSLINFDYMGSSEFEFGALPQSLKRMLQTWDQYVITPLFDIKDLDGQTLFILCRKKHVDEVIASIKVFASEAYPQQLHTKEYVGLYDYLQGKNSLYNKNDFWWDVTGSRGRPFEETPYGNDWMCCFGDNIRLLTIAIHRLMLKRKLSPEAGPKIPSPGYRPIPDTTIKEDNKSILIVKGDKTTTILKQSILDAEIMDSTVIVTIKVKGGSARKISIPVTPPSVCHLLFNLVKNYSK